MLDGTATQVTSTTIQDGAFVFQTFPRAGATVQYRIKKLETSAAVFFAASWPAG